MTVTAEYACEHVLELCDAATQGELVEIVTEDGTVLVLGLMNPSKN